MSYSLEELYKKKIKKVASNIKKARTDNGYTQAQMESFGFDLRNYQRLESGEHSPSLFTLFKLSKAFNVELSELVD